MKTFIRRFSKRSSLEKICVSVTLALILGTLITGIVLAPIVALSSVVGLAVCFVIAYGITILLDMFI